MLEICDSNSAIYYQKWFEVINLHHILMDNIQLYVAYTYIYMYVFAHLGGISSDMLSEIMF